MKIGLIGAGAVGAATQLALIMRGVAREIVVIDIDEKRACGVVTDMRYGAVMSPVVDLSVGNYSDLADAALILITAGVNEKTGGATDRNDPSGRLKLLAKNVEIYRSILERLAPVAIETPILVLTDPPDPLADFVRRQGFMNVLSSGTYLDSLRFRVELARHLRVDPADVEAVVIGEHGTSQVYVWSSARVEGVPVFAALKNVDPAEVRKSIEQAVRYANITIIEGTGASQYGIGMAAARLSEMILRDEHAAIPIGSYNHKHGVTLSMPSVLGRRGVSRILEPDLSDDEIAALERSAETLRQAVASIRA